MCSIIAGSDNKIVRELLSLNQHRGNFSYSCTKLNKNLQVVNQVKEFGPFNQSIIDGEGYKICHVQAPTGGMVEDRGRIHPVSNGDNMLWHNGLITPKGVKFLQDKLDTEETFDTRLLFDAIERFGFSILNDIEGLFSCLMLKDNDMLIFRTKHGKLYTDGVNISSERFGGSKCINANTIYSMSTGMPVELFKFKTKRFNFVVKGEM